MRIGKKTDGTNAFFGLGGGAERPSKSPAGVRES